LLEAFVGLLFGALLIATINRLFATDDIDREVQKDMKKEPCESGGQLLVDEEARSATMVGMPTIVLVHGTFAEDPSNVGNSWWQETSSFQIDLRERLASQSISLDPSAHTFHWSGENLESSRFAAGVSLLALLMRFESRRRPYHLVCHSHGGSVAWEALKQSVSIKRETPAGESSSQNGGLSYLRSWTTIGTPFIRQSVPLVRNWRLAIFNLLRVVLLLGGTVLVLIGAVNGWLLPRSFLISIPLILIWPFIVSLCVGTLMHFAMTEQARADQVEDQRLADHAAQLYRDRWLGVWSSEDEAINGLRVSTALNGPVVPRLKRPPLVFKTQAAVTREIEPIARIWRFCFNRFVAPVLDSVTWSTLAKNIQGNDRPAMRVAKVETSPHATMVSTALPEEVSIALGRIADQKASRMIPQIRLALGQAAAGQGIGIVTKNEDAARALVHTSYFELADVVWLIAHHIATVHGSDSDSEIRKELLLWYREQTNTRSCQITTGTGPPICRG
jgi:hypothetical protein